jgi:protein required for attachment to host cells
MSEHRDTWILVADSSRARLLNTDRSFTDPTLVQELDHPDSRAKTSELVAGSRGRTSPRNSDSTRRAAMEPSTSPKDVEIDRFSRELADLLHDLHVSNELSSLVLIAPPEFLGRLRAVISGPVAATIRAELDKSYVHERPEVIGQILAERLG